MCAESFRFRVGELDCLALSDGTYAFSADMFFANAPEDELKEALQRHGLRRDEVSVSEACLLVHTGDQVALVDTGMGPGLRATAGKLLQNLRAAGIDPAGIDTIVLTTATPTTSAASPMPMASLLSPTRATSCGGTDGSSGCRRRPTLRSTRI